MSKLSKIIVTFISCLVFFLIYASVGAINGKPGGGMIGLILLAALIGGLRALWKNNKNGEDGNKETLN